MSRKHSDALVYFAGWCSIASGIVSFIGIVFLIAMFIGFSTNNIGLQRYGTLNDICIIIQYLLALPITLALYQFQKTYALLLCRAAMLIGIAGMIVIVVLQWLLVSGVLTFEEQVGPVTLALFVVGIWLGITGYLGRLTENMPHSLRVSLLAAFYVGYPIWAIWLGRLLLTQAGRSPSIRGETA
ncbi:MAG: hypothetical protein K8L91_20485 [Anaerolineae bacterium]|nr:hypothetical protein [Anaerolineae bacterium]